MPGEARDRLAPVEARPSLGMREDDAAAGQQQLAEAPDAAPLHGKVAVAQPAVEARAERPAALARPLDDAQQPSAGAARARVARAQDRAARGAGEVSGHSTLAPRSSTLDTRTAAGFVPARS